MGWGWGSGNRFRRQGVTTFIWAVPLLWLGWFIWKAGYAAIAAMVVIGGLFAGVWLQWALRDAQLRPTAARSEMAINDPVYDIPLEERALPTNPASDPLYDIGEDFQATPASPDPFVDPGGSGEANAPSGEAEAVPKEEPR